MALVYTEREHGQGQIGFALPRLTDLPCAFVLRSSKMKAGGLVASLSFFVPKVGDRIWHVGLPPAGTRGRAAVVVMLLCGRWYFFCVQGVRAWVIATCKLSTNLQLPAS